MNANEHRLLARVVFAFICLHLWPISLAAAGANISLMMDQEQFRNGPATIAVTYYSKDPDSGQLVTLTCDTECSTSCIPDTVTVVVDNYQFARFLGYLGLPPIQMPAFQASSPVESAGCDPEQQVCLPCF